MIQLRLQQKVSTKSIMKCSPSCDCDYLSIEVHCLLIVQMKNFFENRIFDSKNLSVKKVIQDLL